VITTAYRYESCIIHTLNCNCIALHCTCSSHRFIGICMLFLLLCTRRPITPYAGPSPIRQRTHCIQTRSTYRMDSTYSPALWERSGLIRSRYIAVLAAACFAFACYEIVTTDSVLFNSIANSQVQDDERTPVGEEGPPHGDMEVGKRKETPAFSTPSRTPSCSASLPPATCTGWGCQVSAGKFPQGPPFFRLRRVCIGSNSVTFYPVSEAHEKELRGLLRSCCGVADLSNRSTAPTPPGVREFCLGVDSPYPNSLLCNSNLIIYDATLRLATWNEPLPSVFLPGDSLFLDTAVTGWHQFKHTTGRLIQYAVLGRTFDHLLMTRVDHLPSDGPHGSREGTTARAIFNITVQPHIDAGLTKVHLSGPRGQPVCAETVYSIPNYEKMHFSREQGEQWRSILRERFAVNDASCPPPHAALLKRMPGDGAMRGFANEHIIDKVAAEFGIEKVGRISIGSKNTTAEHVALFSSIGLLITGHSSQLTNLVFASRHTAVVEIIGTHIPWWLESPFQMGMDNIQVHYNLSRNHAVDLVTCGAQCISNDKNGVITIDESKFRASLHDVILQQLSPCPHLPWHLP
jgi:hypothetical protein